MGSEGDVTVNVVGSGKDERPDVTMRRNIEDMVVDIVWTNVRGNGSLAPLFRGMAA